MRHIKDSAIVEDHVEVRGVIAVVAIGAGAVVVAGDSGGQTMFDQKFNGVVDGCQTDARLNITDLLMKLLSGGMRVCRFEHRINENPWTSATDFTAFKDRPDLRVTERVISLNHLIMLTWCGLSWLVGMGHSL